MTTSIGIALFPDHGTDVQSLLRNVDIALYEAKKHGRNHAFVYQAQMNHRLFERLVLENELRRALDKNEFTLHHQPRIKLENGQVSSEEALLRWDSSVLGTISPADFIPIAEETGLIRPIEQWVLEQVCIQLREWETCGRETVRVAVNISARQFRHEFVKP